MPEKTINMKTKDAIVIDRDSFLASVNELRSSRGANKKSKSATTIEKLLSNTKILEASTEEFGSVSFSIHYKDNEGVSCSRRFPNFGLDVVSNSKIIENGDQISIEVDLTLTAAKKKWQLEEVRECAEIFRGNEYQVTLEYRCDTTSEPAGYSVSLQPSNGIVDEFGNAGLPSTMFECTWK
jgi:hypothetical protein